MGVGGPAVIGGTGLLVLTFVILVISVIAGYLTDYGTTYLASAIFAIAITIAEQWVLQRLLGDKVGAIQYNYNSKSGVARIAQDKIGSTSYAPDIWDLPSFTAQMLSFVIAYWVPYTMDVGDPENEEKNDRINMAVWATMGVLLSYAVVTDVISIEQCVIGVLGGTILGINSFLLSKSIKMRQ
jgi:hypothetical protein